MLEYVAKLNFLEDPCIENEISKLINEKNQTKKETITTTSSILFFVGLWYFGVVVTNHRLHSTIGQLSSSKRKDKHKTHIQKNIFSRNGMNFRGKKAGKLWFFHLFSPNKTKIRCVLKRIWNIQITICVSALCMYAIFSPCPHYKSNIRGIRRQ